MLGQALQSNMTVQTKSAICIKFGYLYQILNTGS
jgi:hypothetical protein